jgi:Xaa-Pro aminopeptidase
MKSDLDAIMQENNLDALLVVGPGDHNPAMVYLTGGGHLTRADLILQRGKKGVLFHGPMERDEAARTGLETRSFSNYPMAELLKETNHDPVQALVLRYQKMFADVRLLRGRVALYGLMDSGSSLLIFSRLQKALPEIKLIGDLQNKVLQKAMATKDSAEVERIRQVGKATVEVVGKTAEFLTSQRVKDEVLVMEDGTPVTIGAVKNRINLWLAERGLENPEGTIFAIGSDAGVPHSSGKPDDVIRLGQPIVFDIFPCEQGGGYFYDLTRTWCLGYAPDGVQKLYDQVYQVYDQVVSELSMGAHFANYQRITCDLFEEMGHPTVQSDPETEVGYVHSLGHGVGLNIHERPASGTTAAPDDDLIPGTIMTIEPGLYYPDKGMGVRLENTYWARPDGKFEALAEYPMDLVLEMRF